MRKAAVRPPVMISDRPMPAAIINPVNINPAFQAFRFNRFFFLKMVLY